MWGTNECNKFLTLLEEKPFWTMLEVFCNNPSQLFHFSGALLNGIHSIFPPPKVSGQNIQDPISKKKLDSDEGQWVVIKEVLVWMVDCATWCIELARDSQRDIYADLHKIISITKGVPSKKI